KSIYGVRTKRHREQRIALDMNREQRASKRARTLKTLHRARSDPESGRSCCLSVWKSEVFYYWVDLAKGCYGPLSHLSVQARPHPILRKRVLDLALPRIGRLSAATNVCKMLHVVPRGKGILATEAPNTHHFLLDSHPSATLLLILDPVAPLFSTGRERKPGT